MKYNIQIPMIEQDISVAPEPVEVAITNRVSYILKPALFVDGNKWCALHGANIQDGVAGFGDSPEEAYLDFDKNWHARLEPRFDEMPAKREPVMFPIMLNHLVRELESSKYRERHGTVYNGDRSYYRNRIVEIKKIILLMDKCLVDLP